MLGRSTKEESGLGEAWHTLSPSSYHLLPFPKFSHQRGEDLRDRSWLFFKARPGYRGGDLLDNAEESPTGRSWLLLIDGYSAIRGLGLLCVYCWRPEVCLSCHWCISERLHPEWIFENQNKLEELAFSLRIFAWWEKSTPNFLRC